VTTHVELASVGSKVSVLSGGEEGPQPMDPIIKTTVAVITTSLAALLDVGMVQSPWQICWLERIVTGRSKSLQSLHKIVGLNPDASPSGNGNGM